MSTRVLQRTTWSMSRDKDGNRDYKIKFRVACSDPADGPTQALLTPTLPTVGSQWVYGNDVDLWATCKQDAVITPVEKSGDPNMYFDIEYHYSSKSDEKRCKDQQIDDPLLVLPNVSGTFQKYTEEATLDMFGNPVVNSAWEQMRGPQVEFDKNRPGIKIQQNVAVLNLALVASMMDTVNQFTLWGQNPRTIKLSGFQWETKYYGLCYKYYSRTFDFDIRFESFDRLILDEGTKALAGHWDPTTGFWQLEKIGGATPNYRNPAHFHRYKDRNGENARVILDGFGLPADVNYIGTGTGTEQGGAFDATPPNILPAGPPGNILVQKYAASDFTILGIPLTF